MSQPTAGSENTGNGGLSEALAWLAGSRMPLVIAGGKEPGNRGKVTDGLLALGALLITNLPEGYYPGNILDLGNPDPGIPLPEQTWKHAEEASKKADLVLVLDPLPPELATLADLAAWSGGRVIRLQDNPVEPSVDDSGFFSDFPVLDTAEALAWLLNVSGLKEPQA